MERQQRLQAPSVLLLYCVACTGRLSMRPPTRRPNAYKRPRFSLRSRPLLIVHALRLKTAATASNLDQLFFFFFCPLWLDDYRVLVMPPVWWRTGCLFRHGPGCWAALATLADNKGPGQPNDKPRTANRRVYTGPW